MRAPAEGSAPQVTWCAVELRSTRGGSGFVDEHLLVVADGGVEDRWLRAADVVLSIQRHAADADRLLDVLPGCAVVAGPDGGIRARGWTDGVRRRLPCLPWEESGQGVARLLASFAHAWWSWNLMGAAPGRWPIGFDLTRPRWEPGSRVAVGFLRSEDLRVTCRWRVPE